MDDGSLLNLQKAARDHAYSIPLDQINVADGMLFKNDTHWPYFERLRKEAPVHLQKEHEFGPYWSITKYNDIMAVDTNHEAFTSEPAITIAEPDADFQLPMFIAMDPPKHDAQRKTVSPAVAPPNLALMEPIIRERAAGILDSLPVGNEEFDWVDKVSIELTTMTLATLFDFPWEDRRKLTYWSDLITAPRPQEGDVVPMAEDGVTPMDEQYWRGELFKMVEYFMVLWNERSKKPGNDLISMLAHGESTKNMDTMEFMGNLILLIVGGNDTTRNTMSGSVYAMNKLFPEQNRIVRANPNLIPNMVSETIRWQTPLAHMRRNATRDVEVGGTMIPKGDKVIMWYVSGNRDEEVIERPNDYWIERPNVRRHLSFGFGIHRCVGNRLAELQLKIIWEEIIKRFPEIHVTGEPTRVQSAFVKGYDKLPVVIPRRV